MGGVCKEEELQEGFLLAEHLSRWVGGEEGDSATAASFSKAIGSLMVKTHRETRAVSILVIYMWGTYSDDLIASVHERISKMLQRNHYRMQLTRKGGRQFPNLTGPRLMSVKW